MSLQNSKSAIVLENILCAHSNPSNVIGEGRFILNSLGLEWNENPKEPKKSTSESSLTVLSIMFTEFSAQGIKTFPETKKCSFFVQRIPPPLKYSKSSGSNESSSVSSSSSSSEESTVSVPTFFWFFLPQESRL